MCSVSVGIVAALHIVLASACITHAGAWSANPCFDTHLTHCTVCWCRFLIGSFLKEGKL